ncbi:hypothetical protein BAY59_03255 [Prauserella coralliicola]|nr:hypothetical protein BAY59_03255 [Prauserella coralliicola]
MSDKAERGRRGGRRPFYGWVQVGGLSATELVSWGVLVYAFSVFVVPMREELGWSVGWLNAVYATGVVVSGLLAMPVGRVLQTRGPRGVMTVGSAGAVLMLLGWSQVDSLPMFFVVFVLGGFAMATTLYEPAFAVTAVWFARDRARAVLVLTIFGGLASAVFVPLTGVLVSWLGWRDALLALAVITAVVTLPVHGLLLRRHPADLGLHPDGSDEPPPPREAAPAPPRQAVLRSASFRRLTVCFVCGTAAKLAVTVVLVAYLTERGYPLGLATLAAGGVGLFQVTGRVLVTALRRWVPEHRAGAALFAAQGVAIALPLTTSGHGTAATVSIIVFVVLFGLGYGLAELLRGTLVADYYGPGEYARINGVLAAFVVGARAAGPALAGVAVAGFGYTPVFAGSALLAAVSAGALLLAHRAHGEELDRLDSLP